MSEPINIFDEISATLGSFADEISVPTVYQTVDVTVEQLWGWRIEIERLQTREADVKKNLLDIISGLMMSDHLGDVCRELWGLCTLAGIPQLEGSHDAWTRQDQINAGWSLDEIDDDE